MKKKKSIAFLQTKLQDKNIIISENNKIGDHTRNHDQQLIEEIDDKLSSYKGEKFKKNFTKF